MPVPAGTVPGGQVGNDEVVPALACVEFPVVEEVAEEFDEPFSGFAGLPEGLGVAGVGVPFGP